MSLIQAILVSVYVFLVSWLMQNGEKIFGQVKGMLAPMTFLLLFVVSAAVTSALVLGRPILLYWEGKKSAGVRLFVYTVLWLAVLLAVNFLTLIFA